MSSSLSSTVHRGIVNLAGATPESKETVERLLEDDREQTHCFHGKVGFHNHRSHHLLAAYDLGASTQQLQRIYDAYVQVLDPINLADRSTGVVRDQPEKIDQTNWTQFLGDEKYYANYIAFFSTEIAQTSHEEVIDRFIFGSMGNEDGAFMFLRLVGGVLHPLIQVGFAVEFGSDAMLAQALAQTAVTKPFYSNVFVDDPDSTPIKDATLSKLSLFEVFRETYNSPIMTPVMPYDPNAFIRERFHDALQDGRPEKIRGLAASWHIDISKGQPEIDAKVEELFWLMTLLLAGTGKPGRAPRLDFFLMHLLNATLFLPSILAIVPHPESKVKLLRAFLSSALAVITIRGRPVINPELLMSYTERPVPPRTDRTSGITKPDNSALGDPRDPACVNPWPVILASVVHAPDAHTVKAVRTLYYAAQKYGTTPAGRVPGALDAEGRETHAGMCKVDGTLFVRAAGVVMETLGWVSYGEAEGKWDRSALGWEDAWKDGN